MRVKRHFINGDVVMNAIHERCITRNVLLVITNERSRHQQLHFLSIIKVMSSRGGEPRDKKCFSRVG